MRGEISLATLMNFKRMLDAQAVPIEGRMLWPFEDEDAQPVDYSHYVWDCACCGQLCEGTFISGTEPEFYCSTCGTRYLRV